tara:strand:- start:249 stop:800 length:552 start_codon:yes stop_codon:yes gene_type:complete
MISNKYTYLVFSFFLLFTSSIANATQFPNTSLAIIDINLVLNESKVAINADKQIAEINNKIQEELSEGEKLLINEQKELIEAQGIMAPEAFEEKRINYEKKVQDFQINSQNTLVKLDKIIADVRNEILAEIEPILEEIAEEKGITVILEKGTVWLNAENMDITKLVIKKLNKNISKIKVEFEE